MINNKTFLCIIPARGGSKGIINKNIIDLNGSPLISYCIKSSINSGIFDRIIVSTDSEEIANVSKGYGAEVPFIRPSELATDKSLIQDTLFHALKYIEQDDRKYNYVCLIQPTTPLMIPEDICNSVKMLEEKNADMIISVGKSPINIGWARTLPEDFSMINFKVDICGTNKQCYEDVYYLNGSIYLGKWDIFYEKKDYYSQKTYAYIMPYERSIDVDKIIDIKLVNFFLRERDKNI